MRPKLIKREQIAQRNDQSMTRQPSPTAVAEIRATVQTRIFSSEREKSMLKIVDGSLLDSDCQYIAHQCNCYSRRSAGLASAIFKAFPWADVYSSRSERGNDTSLFGSITVHGDPKRSHRCVINIYGQLKPGKPSPGRDSAASRLEAFGKALDQIAKLPELESIGFPYGIGCGLAGGDWNEYERFLEDFADRVGERSVSVVLYRLGQ